MMTWEAFFLCAVVALIVGAALWWEDWVVKSAERDIRKALKALHDLVERDL